MPSHPSEFLFLCYVLRFRPFIFVVKYFKFGPFISVFMSSDSELIFLWLIMTQIRTFDFCASDSEICPWQFLLIKERISLAWSTDEGDLNVSCRPAKVLWIKWWRFSNFCKLYSKLLWFCIKFGIAARPGSMHKTVYSKYA